MPGLKNALPLIFAALAAPAAMAQTAQTPAEAPTAAPAPESAPAAAPAADVPAPAAPPAPLAALPACELHVWPAFTVSAQTQGAAAGFGLVGALIDISAHADQNKRDTAFITGSLDAQAQARVIRDMDLPAALHLPPSRVIFHDQGVQAKGSERLSDSTAPCYAEFVVRGLSFFQSIVYEGQMRTYLELRRFEGPVVKVDFRDSKHEDLKVKLPKEGEDTGPATDALIGAFRGDVAFFADKYSKRYK